MIPSLSILIPAIPERANMLMNLLDKLYNQLDGIPIDNDVEILVFMDNRVRSIGMKREGLKKLAKGKYFCFLDDDDDVTDDYLFELWSKCKDEDVDVICFDSLADVEGVKSQVSVSIKNQNEQYNHDGDTLRKPCHVNCWNTKKFKKYHFSDASYGEDFYFAEKCYPHITTSYKIDKILHYYNFRADISKADN